MKHLDYKQRIGKIIQENRLTRSMTQAELAKQSLNPVAALYSARNLGVALDEAWAGIRNTLPDYDPKRFLRDAVGRIVGGE